MVVAHPQSEQNNPILNKDVALIDQSEQDNLILNTDVALIDQSEQDNLMSIKVVAIEQTRKSLHFQLALRRLGRVVDVRGIMIAIEGLKDVPGMFHI
ncbi:hypothetical protein BofuT4_uP009710.1 [Botrytis cinerea T4]|uniref:Uncharacterized protein n=1 Tax=Botryotinia fuckeliana (strain T4) TaxID=999810 RepID=G2XT09_BOTF4|nr:hypothetical protein BofuT4_uP009710.1 [Botrytis cinerea T4]